METGIKKYTYDIILAIIIVIHLLTREWPTGGGLQTAVDILIIIALILTVIRFMSMKPGQEEQSDEQNDGHSDEQQQDEHTNKEG